MKTINPTINDIQNLYFNYGTCTITFKDKSTITGNFRPGRIAESGKITGWKFTKQDKTEIITIFYDQISEIKNAVS